LMAGRNSCWLDGGVRNLLTRRYWIVRFTASSQAVNWGMDQVLVSVGRGKSNCAETRFSIRQIF
jgi:hypothetical protein